MNEIIIIQARLSSTRMPGKVLLPIWSNKCILDLQLGKLKKLNVPMILATTTNNCDDNLVRWAKDNDIEIFRGSEENVLDRFVDCANHHVAKNIIRVCSDNPFIQTNGIRDFISQLEEGADYVSFVGGDNVPTIKQHWGLFVEGVSLKALLKSKHELKNNPQSHFYCEHVTNYIYGHPDRFNLRLSFAPEIIKNRFDLRFTIDTSEDFKNMKRLLGLINGNVSLPLKSLVKVVDQNLELKKVMNDGIKNFSK